ncbi:MAG: Rieske 2Fe-2S domain-containing protein [Anaerolineales bacterium]|nr:Rieske 2Fe-2S domain-containing protein [Anaerolineales bacterium]MDD5466377.1 Rieske 2Fe-2S domain-containing protein [Anaerolineales bacterium]
MQSAEHTIKPNAIPRRSFLNLAFFSSLALLLAQSLAALVKFLKPVPSGGFGGEVYAGRVDEFTVGSVNRVLAGRFYLVRTEEGLLALWQRCTHLGCSVPWVDAEAQFHCPCHGSLFNNLGEVTGGPAPRPLDIFPISIRNGEVWVDTGKPIQRSRFDAGQVTRA